MASIITEIIPQQSFEIVLNRLGAILLEEISNQVQVQALPDDVEIFIERMEGFDKSEDIVINVSCNNMNYQGQVQRGSQSDTTFFIDVYSTGEASASGAGHKDVRMKLHRYIGMCRYILSSTKYKTLGFEAGIVTGVNVTGVQFNNTDDREQADFIRMARLSLSVKIYENQEMWDAIVLQANDTTIKLDETEKGYKLIFNT